MLTQNSDDRFGLKPNANFMENYDMGESVRIATELQPNYNQIITMEYSVMCFRYEF